MIKIAITLNKEQKMNENQVEAFKDKLEKDSRKL